jgi:hypothetical protein
MDPCGLEATRSLGFYTRETEEGVAEGLPSLQQEVTPPVTLRNTFTTNTNLDKVGLVLAPSPTDALKTDWQRCVDPILHVILVL